MSHFLRKFWLITGASSGLGRELALAALSRGDKVIATGRSVDKLKDLQKAHPDSCRVLQLDVTDSFDSLSAKAKEAVALWGRLDVLVNNAGYGLFGTIEESGVDGLMTMYKTNVFGVVNVTNAFLPYMRRQRSGTVVIIGSRSGWSNRFPTTAPALYGSSKAALHAISDSLSQELRPQGIRVLRVVPGGLRTQSINNSSLIGNAPLALPAPDIEIGEVPEYSEIRATAHDIIQKTNGAESGGANKAAKVVVDVVRGEGVAEGRASTDILYLGSDCVRDVSAKCQEVLKDLEDWGDVARSIDIDQQNSTRAVPRLD